MKKSALNSPRLSELKKKRRNTFFSKIFIFLFVVLILGIFFTYLFRLERFNISNIEIVGNKIIETEEIKKIVQEEMEGYYFWLFPKTNFIIYPKQNIEQALREKFKRIKDIFINDKEIRTLEISMTERKASSIWCGDTLPENNIEEKCLFLDEEGYIFDEAPYFSDEVYFKFYGLTSLEIPLGAYFEKDNFKQMIYFKDFLTSINLKPISFYISPEKNGEIYLSSGVSLIEGPKILLKTDADFQNIAENLKTALATDPLKTEFKNKYTSLQYIDLRFGNKVYYKFE